jgi:uncharacterized protein YciI
VFIIVLDYLCPLATVERHVAAHRAHLAEQYAAGKLVVSGPQVPRTGGVIVARCGDRAEVEAMMQCDPFIREGVARYRVIEFVARAACAELAEWVE